MAAALQLALLTGMLQLLLGTVRAGLVVSSLSRPAIGGFTSAAVLLMGLSQGQEPAGLSGDGGESALELSAGVVRDLAQRAGWQGKYGKQIYVLSLNQAVRQMSTESTNSHGSSKEAETFSGPATSPTGSTGQGDSA